jgi:hypothetical protein
MYITARQTQRVAQQAWPPPSDMGKHELVAAEQHWPLQ